MELRNWSWGARGAALVMGIAGLVAVPACSDNVEGNPDRGSVSAPRDKTSLVPGATAGGGEAAKGGAAGRPAPDL